jgi:TRAP-type C4-dicarboxylate transport system permease small subunit
VIVLAAVIGFGIPRLIAVMPPQWINLPNRGYWLAPERLADTMEFLNAYFAWFGCALFTVILVAFDYAIQSNLHPSHAPGISRMWYLLAGFLLFAIVSMARMFRRFACPPQDSPSLK